MDSNLKHLFGLIGYPLSHSFSATFFNQKFSQLNVDAEYRLFPMEDLKNVRQLQQKYPTLKGLNVTLPHKKTIMQYLDWISQEAESVGAVNTISIGARGWYGYNTDIIGFEFALFNFWKKLEGKRALIIGRGGAAASVVYVLQNHNIEADLVGRQDFDSLKSMTVNDLDKYTLIVNATPLGMFPHEESCPPIPLDLIKNQHFVFDMVYNPEKTIFLSRAEKQGAFILNGLTMLYAQAEASWDIWKQDLY
jgi:shikimate dehydrogenase